jgi:hypothetical protein
MISQWNTPIATPVAVPVSSAPEPLSVILQKHNLDINERVRQVCTNVMHSGPTRILSDTSALLEQLPNLLLLLKEASAPTAWLTDESVSSLMELFGLKSGRSLSRLLLQGNATFVFPLSSLPPSIDWTSSEFGFFKHLSYSQRKSLIDLHAKTLHLDAMDYFFFVLGTLSITSTAFNNTGPGSWWSAPATNAPPSSWYDATKKGSVYDRLLLELLDLVVGTENRSSIPPVLLHKAELTLATLSDLVLDLHLFSFNNTSVDFEHVFAIIDRIVEKLLAAGALDKNSVIQTSISLAPFIPKAVKLMNDLLEPNNFYSVKFMHKMNPGTFRAFARLYHRLCVPWRTKDVARPLRDLWLKRNTDMYRKFQGALTVPAIVDFVHEYRSHEDHMKLAAFKDTKPLVEGIADLLTIASPSTGLVEALPTVFEDARAPVETLWDVCRGCTWINGKVPKELTDASWQLDTIVNATKASAVGADSKPLIYNAFTWETPLSPRPVSDEIPRNLKTLWLKDKPEVTLSGGPSLAHKIVAWDQPVCANEIAWAVKLLRNLVGQVSGADLKRKPAHLAWLRSFASVTVLIAAVFFAWMFVSIVVCPDMDSAMAIGAVQFIFMVLMGLLAMKWVSSQYIV